MKLKQGFSKTKITKDMYPMLLFAIKQVLPEFYNACYSRRMNETTIILFALNESIDEISYYKIIDICEKYKSMQAFS